MAKVNEKAIEYIRRIPPPFRIIAEKIRGIILKVGTEMDIRETFQNQRPVYQIEEKPYFYIEKLPKHHIRLGIYSHRTNDVSTKNDVNQIEIRSKEDIESLGIAELIRKTLQDI
jgi:hypothetical protein